MSILLIAIGLALLVFGGDYLVKGAAGMALKFTMPPMLVGMTVVAFGTSAPELVVSLQAALAGKSDIAIGNVVGSNIANVALILGLTVIIFPIAVKKDSLKYDWTVMMIASISFYFLALDGNVSRIEGILMFCALILFILWSFLRTRTHSWLRLKPRVKAPAEKSELAVPVEAGAKPTWLLLFFVVAGSVALVFGARWFLQGAEMVALSFGLSDRVIAISLVAFGTSVPELAASVIAAFKKEQDISLGNIIGSNLFNLLSILGITAMVQPISVSAEIMSHDIFWMLATSFAILPLSIRKLRFNRLGGVLLLATYITFVYILLNNP